MMYFRIRKFLLLVAILITASSVFASDGTTEPEIPYDVLQRQGNNALYVELLGNGINLFGLNYERTVRPNVHLRGGATYLGFSRKYRYEEGDDDMYIGLASFPLSASYTFFEGIRQLEVSGGVTLFAFQFEGGPFEVGYQDIEFGNRYHGLALTTYIGYRISVQKYLFRIGVSPYYMLTLHSDVSGILEELDDRGILEFRDILDFNGFRFIPGLSFGRTF